jgi:hypothetical protein
MNIDNYFSKFAIERLNFFAGYAAKKWPLFGAVVEALFQELRARRKTN